MSLLVAMGLATSMASGAELAVTSSDGTEVPITVFPANSSQRLVWLPSEDGVGEAERRVARQLAANGVEVWLLDVLAARFLPPAASSLDSVPGDDVAAVLQAAQGDGRRLYALATSRGAIPLLRGLRVWQRRGGQVAGVILLHPILYVETPEPGVAPRLMPIVSATNQAVYLVQPELSPSRWRLAEVVAGLEGGGSEVFIQSLPAVRDRYYYRPDALAVEQQAATTLPRLLQRAMGRLAYIEHPRPAPATPLDEPAVVVGKPERALQPYAGPPLPPPLRLADMNGVVHDLAELKGRVVVVNFWASWCPPCVHEMPSLSGLYRRLQPHGLEVVAVNMAESSATVAAFLHRGLAPGLPVWLDEDGAALRRWGVFAFPTTYVVDRRGRVRYAQLGGVDWEAPARLAVLEALLAE